MKTWWLSFCNPDAPEGAKFLGVLIVDAETMSTAVDETHRHGINPGGVVLGCDISTARPDDSFHYRLISEDEARSVFGAKTLTGI